MKRTLSFLLAAMMIVTTLTAGMTVQAALPFNDTDGHWGESAIEYVVENGLMNGVGNGESFAPNMSLTRGMVVTVLYRDNGSPKQDFKGTFLDVKEGAYYTAAAEWAFENEIVNGTGTDEWGEPYFSPDRDITRQELATMFKRYADFKHVDTSKGSTDIASFPDASSVADWAKDAVKWSVGVGLITGKSNGGAATLSPTDKAVRAEFATIIKRFKEADFEYHLVYEKPVLKSSFTEIPYAKVENADIYVAVDGNNNNPGTKDKPLATFEAAKSKARELKKSGNSAVVIAFKAGDYGTLDNIEFTAEDSNATYCAYGDGDVYFTGGVFVKESEFKALSENEKALFNSAHADSIKKADLSGYAVADLLDSSSLLFNDDGFCTLARYPNMKNGVTATIEGKIVQQIPLPGHTHEELMEIAQTTGDQDLLKTLTDQKKVTALAHFKKQLDTYTSPEGVQICGNISKIWHADNLDIESYDKSTGIISFKQNPHYGFVNYDENYASVFISGASVDLDTVGEYWYDAENKALYVYAPAGEYLMSYQDSFITMKKTNNIVFKKLNFRGTTDTTITLENCNGFTFDMCSLLCSGGTYGFWGDESINIKITNSELAYFADEGIHIQSPTSEYAVEGYHPDALKSDGLVIDNNSIHDIGMITVGVDTSGIRLCNTVNSQITHNEVYNSNRCAMRFDDCMMLDIAYNYFHHCMLTSADGGVLYSFRTLTFRETNVRYNLFTDIPNRTGAQYALYNDGAHAWNVYGNIFYDAASVNVVLNGGRDNVVYDNICIRTNGKGGFYMYNSDMIDEEYGSEIKIGPDEEVNATFDRLRQKPEKGEPYYEDWYARWPEIYDFLLDFEDVDKGPQCIYYTINYFKNNYLFNMSCSVDEGSIADKFGVFEGNLELTTDTNDYFVDPTHGDYSPKDSSVMPNNHFDKIGRY